MSNVTIETPAAPLILYDHGPRHGYRPPNSVTAKRVLLVQQTAICDEKDWRNAGITSIQKYVDHVGARLERDNWMLAVRSEYEPADVDMGPRADFCLINDAEDPIDAVYRDYVRYGASEQWAHVVNWQDALLRGLAKAFPAIRFGYYARPRVTYFAEYERFRPWAEVVGGEREELIDRYIESVWPVVQASGVLWPSLYDYFDDADSRKPFANTSAADAQISMVEASMEICREARRRFNPSALIIPCVTPWFWSKAYSKGACFPIDPFEVRTQQIEPAKKGGADGVFVWNGISWTVWAVTTYPDRYPTERAELAASFFQNVDPESINWKSRVVWDAVQARADRILDAALTTCHEVFAPPPPVVVEPVPEPKPEPEPEPEVPTEAPPAAEDPAPPAPEGDPLTITTGSLLRIVDGLRSIAHGANAVAQELDQIRAEIGA